MRDCATTLAPEVTEAELKALTALLENSQFDGLHLEIGTAAGGTLKAMMGVYSDTTRPDFVVVDPMTYFPDQRQIVDTNLRAGGLDPAEVDFRTEKSWTVFQQAERDGEKFDFIFIDGNHKAKYVIQDLCWSRLLEPGGCLCLHDYSIEHKGVIWAVDRFLSQNPAYERIDLVDSLIILKKMKTSAHFEVCFMDRLIGRCLSFIHSQERSIKKRMNKQMPS